MNNEEKILEILFQIQKDQSDMRADITAMKSEMADMNQRLRKVEVTQETTVVSSLQLLVEGKIPTQNQIKGLSVIDSMQDDIAVLKNAVRLLSDKVEKMEVKMEKDQDQEKAG